MKFQLRVICIILSLCIAAAASAADGNNHAADNAYISDAGCDGFLDESQNDSFADYILNWTDNGYALYSYSRHQTAPVKRVKGLMERTPADRIIPYRLFDNSVVHGWGRYSKERYMHLLCIIRI